MGGGDRDYYNVVLGLVLPARFFGKDAYYGEGLPAYFYCFSSGSAPSNISLITAVPTTATLKINIVYKLLTNKKRGRTAFLMNF